MPMLIRRAPDTEEKLAILSRDGRFDLACSCGTADDEHRRRGRDERWVYPAALPGGGSTFLFKTLVSNECVNNCRYCPLRQGSAARACSLEPEELARAFLAYQQAGRVGGLFLSSAVAAKPDATMEKINTAALLVRRRRFRGHIHLKIIPGASEEAIRQSLSLASAVSINIEAPGERNFQKLCTTKDYMRDVIEPIKLISRLTAKGERYEGVRQTTQFVVGASTETDREIIDYAWGLYRRLHLNRIYFSAYQRGAGASDLPGERSNASNGALLMREHRLYQVDWLMRKYGFAQDEISLGDDGNLSLEVDPKEAWARAHPEFFPVDLNRDGRQRLLRVPGLGATYVSRILAFRRSGAKITRLEDLGRANRTLSKAQAYVRL